VKKWAQATGRHTFIGFLRALRLFAANSPLKKGSDPLEQAEFSMFFVSREVVRPLFQRAANKTSWLPIVFGREKTQKTLGGLR
jgi:hypothetical protein